jgi:hypothetical protein
MLNIDCLCPTCQVCQMTKKEHTRKKYGLLSPKSFLCFTYQVCQITKKERKKYGMLPPKIVESDPWFMVYVDLVGPFTLRTPYKTHSVLALTMIDPATGWFEIVEATNKSATSIQDLFHETWLARYDYP